LDVEQLEIMYGCSAAVELCSPFGATTCNSVSSCTCAANTIKVSADIEGQACEVCAMECLAWPEASTYEGCQCPSTLVKKTSQGIVNGESAPIYSCATPEQLHCPSNGLCVNDPTCTCPPEMIRKENDGCFRCDTVESCPGPPSGTSDSTCVCGAGEVKKSFIVDGEEYFGCRPEVAECSYSGCTTDDTCTCAQGKMKRTLTTTSGDTCWGCRDPCPMTPGDCSTDFSCGCLEGQRTLIFTQSGDACLACRSAPVTQHGCACKQSWSANGYGSEDYCDPVGSSSICQPVDSSCEATGWYGWCARDY